MMRSNDKLSPPIFDTSTSFKRILQMRLINVCKMGAVGVHRRVHSKYGRSAMLQYFIFSLAYTRTPLRRRNFEGGMHGAGMCRYMTDGCNELQSEM